MNMTFAYCEKYATIRLPRTHIPIRTESKIKYPNRKIWAREDPHCVRHFNTKVFFRKTLI